jgi:hypothetical protein
VRAGVSAETEASPSHAGEDFGADAGESLSASGVHCGRDAGMRAIDPGAPSETEGDSHVGLDFGTDVLMLGGEGVFVRGVVLVEGLGVYREGVLPAAPVP